MDEEESCKVQGGAGGGERETAGAGAEAEEGAAGDHNIDVVASQGERTPSQASCATGAPGEGEGAGAGAGAGESVGVEIDVADESSSMNRVLAWDPWASLALMKSEGLASAAPTATAAAGSSQRALSATDTAHVASILKRAPEGCACACACAGRAMAGAGCARRASSACASCSSAGGSGNGSATASARGSRLEPLPIGDSSHAPSASLSPGLKHKMKRVQWRHEVEVASYALDSDGRALLTMHVEPLHEEAEPTSAPAPAPAPAPLRLAK